MNILWSAQAVQDLAEILDSIPREEAIEAHETCDHIERAVAALADFPESGVRGRVDGTREAVVAALPHTIVYRVARDEVTVIALCPESGS